VDGPAGCLSAVLTNVAQGVSICDRRRLSVSGGRRVRVGGARETQWSGVILGVHRVAAWHVRVMDVEQMLYEMGARELRPLWIVWTSRSPGHRDGVISWTPRLDLRRGFGVNGPCPSPGL